MDRFTFLKTLGLSGAALLTVLASCQTDSVTPVGPIDFNVDLNDAGNAALTRVGGYVISNGVIVARTNASDFVAVTRTCSHAGRPQVTFQNGEFYCTAHGARFDASGRGLNSEGKRGLTVYKIDRRGNTLRVYS